MLVEQVARLAQYHGTAQYPHRHEDEVGEAAEDPAARRVDRHDLSDDLHEEDGERERLEAQASGHEVRVVRERLEEHRGERKNKKHLEQTEKF